MATRGQQTALEFLKKSMGARHRVGIDAFIEIDSLESIPGLHKRLKIRAQVSILLPPVLPIKFPLAKPQSTIFTRDETGSVCLPPQLERNCNFTGDGKCNERGWACTPPHSPAWANFTLMMECTPESSRFFSVYSVVGQTKNSRLSLRAKAEFLDVNGTKV
jgi:hypothetical protein